jgi:hypothetical protein
MVVDEDVKEDETGLYKLIKRKKEVHIQLQNLKMERKVAFQNL